MASQISPSAELPVDDIKRVPQDAETRKAIRSAAVQSAAVLDRLRAPSREDLERCGQNVLAGWDSPAGSSASPWWR